MTNLVSFLHHVHIKFESNQIMKNATRKSLQTKWSPPWWPFWIWNGENCPHHPAAERWINQIIPDYCPRLQLMWYQYKFCSTITNKFALYRLKLLQSASALLTVWYCFAKEHKILCNRRMPSIIFYDETVSTYLTANKKLGSYKDGWSISLEAGTQSPRTRRSKFRITLLPQPANKARNKHSVALYIYFYHKEINFIG